VVGVEGENPFTLDAGFQQPEIPLIGMIVKYAFEDACIRVP
jgi:hypothetical protein